jgi:hypothetical protein
MIPPTLQVSIGVVGRMTLNEGVALLGGCAMGLGLFDAGLFEGFCGGLPLGEPATGLTLVFELELVEMASLGSKDASRGSR